MYKCKLVFISAMTSVSFLNPQTVTAANPTPYAEAHLNSKSSSRVSGMVRFSETAQGLEIYYSLSGLAKNGQHGFHIHEKGDCSSADAKSAGGHYAQVSVSGGTSKETPAKYAGDLPQIQADENGNATGKLTSSDLSLRGKNAVLNRAIMIHGGPDDVTKASAPRIACGVISAK